MPPRLRICPQCLLRQTRSLPAARHNAPALLMLSTRSASTQAITPAPSHEQITYKVYPVSTTPPTQPPSHRQPDIRRTQLHRQYTSMLRSSPLILLFQHNNLRAVEWAALRRELAAALAAVDKRVESAAAKGSVPVSAGVRLQIVRGGVFGAALRVVEAWDGSSEAIHATSREAHAAARAHPPSSLQPLLLGPLAALSFPALSTAHLRTALQLLSPKAPLFPPPSRRERPGYWEPSTQAAVRKLMLLGARVEGTVFDGEGTRWVGGIEGGIDGLRAQLVAMLQGVGGSLAATLEGAGNSLYFTMESRRMDMEKEAGGSELAEPTEAAEAAESEKA